MLKSDISELKKRFCKEGCTVDKIAGCYVNSEKEKVCTFTDSFLTLEEEDFFKYLDIAKKSLSGTIGNHLMEYEFPNVEEAAGGRQALLMSLRDNPTDAGLLGHLYDSIIENFECDDNYLILVFHDAYDIPLKGSDGADQGESDEVFEYILIGICRVSLDKPALKYNSDSKEIRSRERDRIVGMPETAILFPAFTERTPDIHSVCVYNKNPKESHAELIDGVLGCEPERTLEEKREAFYEAIRGGFDNTEAGEKAVLSATKDIHDSVVSTLDKSEQKESMDASLLDDLLCDNKRFSDDMRKAVVKAYEETGGLGADVLANESLLKKNRDAVQVLELEETIAEMSRDMAVKECLNTDVVDIHTPNGMGQYVKIQDIDGEPMVCIPAEDVEVFVNGCKLR